MVDIVFYKCNDSMCTAKFSWDFIHKRIQNIEILTLRNQHPNLTTDTFVLRSHNFFFGKNCFFESSLSPISYSRTISNSESEAAAWMETLLNSLPTKTERNAVAVPPLDSPTSVENNEDQNLLGDFNLLESLKEDGEMSDKC